MDHNQSTATGHTTHFTAPTWSVDGHTMAATATHPLPSSVPLSMLTHVRRMPVATTLPLQGWLADAGIAPERLDALLDLLSQNWVQDVSTLRTCLPTLESKLPAVAFVAISQAMQLLQEKEAAAEGGSTGGKLATAGSAEAAGSSSSDKDASASAAALEGTIRSPEHEAAILFQRHQEMEAAKRREAFRAEVGAQRRTLRNARTHWWVLSPSSRLARLWELLVLLCCAWSALVTPFEVGLLDLGHDLSWQLNRAIDAVFSLDVLVNLCCLAYREPASRGGRLVRRPSLIARRYVRSGAFARDALAALPWELLLLYIGSGYQPSAMLHGEGVWGVRGLGARLVRLAALVRLLKVGARLGRALASLRRWEAPRPLAVLPALSTVLLPCVLGGLALLTHWLACLWAYVGRSSRTYTQVGTVDPASTSSWIDQAGLGLDVPPHVLYAAALQTAVSATLGGFAPAATPAAALAVRSAAVAATTTAAPAAALAAAALAAPLSEAEGYMHAFMLLVGGGAWAGAIALCCCSASAAWPDLGVAASETDELDAMALAHQLPPPLSARLAEYFEASRRPIGKTEVASRVLGGSSARLSGDVAAALARLALQRVRYLRPSLGLEVDFFASVGLALRRVVVPPREQILCTSLTVLESGLAIRRGRLLPPASHFGEDMVIALPALRDTAAAVALTYVSTLSLSRDALIGIFESGDFPRAAYVVREAAVRLALRRAVVLVAKRARALQQQPPPPDPPQLGDGGEVLLLSGQPMRELLLASYRHDAPSTTGASATADEAATAAATTALSAASSAAAAVTAAAATAATTEAAAAAAEARLRVELDTCGARLEATLDALAAQMPLAGAVSNAVPGAAQRSFRHAASTRGVGSSRAHHSSHSLSPPRAGRSAAGRTVRARRNNHQARYPAAPTFVVPREGLPADHLIPTAADSEGVNC